MSERVEGTSKTSSCRGALFLIWLLIVEMLVTTVKNISDCSLTEADTDVNIWGFKRFTICRHIIEVFTKKKKKKFNYGQLLDKLCDRDSF